MGITPFLEVSPGVGLIPTTPLIIAGPIIEESVSVPKLTGTILADTATAEPALEPTTKFTQPVLTISDTTELTRGA